jgi:hypothetical protein
MVEAFARLPVEVDVASEFRYRQPVLDSRVLAVPISQSGETADTLAALREVKDQGARSIAIFNVVGSSIAREADGVLYTRAGLEIGVASTKAFTAQLTALLLLALKLGLARGFADRALVRHVLKALADIPDLMASVLEQHEAIKRVATRFAAARDFLYLGRGADVVKYLRDLEETLIRALASYGVSAGRVRGQAGVWIGLSKIAAVGVRVSRFVTKHGYAINVSSDLSYFSGIVPCGITDKGVTSLRELIGHVPSVEEFGAEVERQFAEVFGRELAAA